MYCMILQCSHEIRADGEVDDSRSWLEGRALVVENFAPFAAEGGVSRAPVGAKTTRTRRMRRAEDMSMAGQPRVQYEHPS